jgi:5-dehydro-2-deoxygluconokinase
MVGRTIFHEPSRRWLDGEIGDAACIAEVRANFETLIGIWRASRQGLTA